MNTKLNIIGMADYELEFYEYEKLYELINKAGNGANCDNEIIDLYYDTFDWCYYKKNIGIRIRIQNNEKIFSVNTHISKKESFIIEHIPKLIYIKGMNKDVKVLHVIGVNKILRTKSLYIDLAIDRVIFNNKLSDVKYYLSATDEKFNEIAEMLKTKKIRRKKLCNRKALYSIVKSNNTSNESINPDIEYMEVEL